jgi:hypothetical protein
MTTAYNRPDRFRLKRVHGRVVKALDELHRAGGELYPDKFAPFRSRLDAAMGQLAGVRDEVFQAVMTLPPEQTERLPLGDDLQEAAE